MTAEIAILNKSGVALAADSLVTISPEGRPAKTYVVDKLFMLSKYHPVGIMVYGGAELLGVPWETIIKVYRRHLGDRSFATIDDYSDDLVEFLSSADLFTTNDKRTYAVSSIAGYFTYRVKKDIDRAVELSAEQDKVTESEINRLAREVIRKHHRMLHNHDTLPHLPRPLCQYD